MELRLNGEGALSTSETETTEVLVFDTGPLTHFAKENWLGVLKAVVGKRRAIVPDVVMDELQQAAVRDDMVRAVLQASWIERHELKTADEIRRFAEFSALLVRGDRNKGEAGVLALASTINGVAVIDDAAGRKAAHARGVALKPTLALLCEAIRKDLLTVPLVSALVDDLSASQYRLPFRAGGFERWVKENGLFQ